MNPEQDAAKIAEAQQGAFSLRQVLAAGSTSEEAKHRVRRGTWGRTDFTGVYRAPGSPRTWEQQLSALVQAAGPGGAASHRSAAALLGIPGFPRRPLEALTLRPGRERAAHALVHSTRVLPDRHLTVVEGIPTTRVARTLVDLAGMVSPKRTERAIDACLSRGSTDVVALIGMTKELAQRGRRGITVMRTLLGERSEGYIAPASELEARFRDLLAGAGLPEPVLQHNVGTAERWLARVDFAYPPARLIIELDGRRYHSAKLDMESDRSRDNSLVAAGWRVVRFTWHDLVERPHEVIALIRAILSGVAA